jgi:hypothetical protein
MLKKGGLNGAYQVDRHRTAVLPVPDPPRRWVAGIGIATTRQSTRRDKHHRTLLRKAEALQARCNSLRRSQISVASSKLPLSLSASND